MTILKIFLIFTKLTWTYTDIMRLMMVVWNFRIWSLQHQTDNNSRPITRSRNSFHTALSTHAISRNYDECEKKLYSWVILFFRPVLTQTFKTMIILYFTQELQHIWLLASLAWKTILILHAPLVFNHQTNYTSWCSLTTLCRFFFVHLITLRAPNHLISWITYTVATTHQLRAT